MGDVNWQGTSEPTWNNIFASVAPKMMSEATDRQLRLAFQIFFKKYATEEFENDKEFKGMTLRDFQFKEHELDTCTVQLRALGLIEESIRKRSLRDSSTYWTLTSFGDNQMVRLRALRKTPIPERKPSEKTEKLDLDFLK